MYINWKGNLNEKMIYIDLRGSFNKNTDTHIYIYIMSLEDI